MVKLENLNHLFQECATGDINEYKDRTNKISSCIERNFKLDF